MNQDQNTAENEFSSEPPSRNPQASKVDSSKLPPGLKEPVTEPVGEKSNLPLFLRNSSGGSQSDLQDEKYENAE